MSTPPPKVAWETYEAAITLSALPENPVCFAPSDSCGDDAPSCHGASLPPIGRILRDADLAVINHHRHHRAVLDPAAARLFLTLPGVSHRRISRTSHDAGGYLLRARAR